MEKARRRLARHVWTSFPFPDIPATPCRAWGPLALFAALTGALYRDVASALPASARTLGAVRAAATCMLHIVASTLDAFAGQRAERGAAGADAGAAGGSSSNATASSGSNGGQAYNQQALALKAPAGGAAGGATGGSGGGGGGGSVSAAVVDLRPLVETVAAVLRPLAHDGVAVAAELPEGLPAVTADATRLNQVGARRVYLEARRPFADAAWLFVCAVVCCRLHCRCAQPPSLRNASHGFMPHTWAHAVHMLSCRTYAGAVQPGWQRAALHLVRRGARQRPRAWAGRRRLALPRAQQQR